MSLFDKSYNEKRDFLRMKIQTPLGVELSGKRGRFNAICRELSGGGMLVETQEQLMEGDELEVNVISTHGHSPQLHAKVQVVRLETEGETQLAGMQILEMLD